MEPLTKPHIYFSTTFKRWLMVPVPHRDHAGNIMGRAWVTYRNWHEGRGR